MKRKIRWAILGVGDIAQRRVAPAINADENSLLQAVVRRDREKARQFAAEHRSAKFYGSAEEAIRDPEVDAVYVATPVALHKEQTIAAAKAGKHVLCEKPMAMNAEECTEMIEAARAGRVTLGVAYYRRFYPKIERTKEILQQGRIGKIVLVRINLHSRYAPAPDDPKRWRMVKSESGGGPMMDVGSHRLDLLVNFFDLPKRVTGRSVALVHQYDVEDSGNALMELGNGATAVANILWSAGAPMDVFEIVGSEGKVRLDPLDSPNLTLIAGKEKVEERIPLPQNAHFPLIADFAKALIEGRPPRIPGEEGRKTSQIIDAVYRAQAEGVWVDLTRGNRTS